MHKVNSFVTLTYDDDHYRPDLHYPDFQLFMKRLRKAKGPTRFFCAGEYGSLNARPHWHALLFGQTFSNMQLCGKDLYRSKELEQLWTEGFSSIGEVNAQTAAYVSSYCTKKLTGNATPISLDLRTGAYVTVPPEGGRMSRRPGLGDSFFRAFWPEIYLARDGIVGPKGHLKPAPRFYDRKLFAVNPTLFIEKETQRQLTSITRQSDNTPQRLQTKEIYQLAKLKLKAKKL